MCNLVRDAKSHPRVDERLADAVDHNAISVRCQFGMRVGISR
jgi:hypothetical protein